MRRISDDTPAYAREAIASAEVGGRPLAASSGLFVVLLVVMSLVEAPLSRSDGSPHHPVNEMHTTPVASPPVHPSTDMPVVQISGATPGLSPAAEEPSCVPSRAPGRLTWHPGGAAHPPRG